MNRLVDWAKLADHHLTALHKKANEQELLDLHTLMWYMGLDYCPCDGCGYRLFMTSQEFKEITTHSKEN